MLSGIAGNESSEKTVNPEQSGGTKPTGPEKPGWLGCRRKNQ